MDRVRILYLFGAGGHGRELGWLARKCYPQAELSYVVDDAQFLSGPVNEIPVRLVSEINTGADTAFVVTIGDGAVRRGIAEALSAHALTPTTLVHPRIELAPTVQISSGVIIAEGSVVTDNVSIGAHTHVNIGCTLSHDVTLGEYVTLSPGVHIAGNVTVEDGAFLGIGVSVINGSAAEPLTIGAGAVVAAGACVTESVAPGTVVGGVPARPLRSGRES